MVSAISVDPAWVAAILASLTAGLAVARWATRWFRNRAERIEENEHRWAVVLGAPAVLDHEGNEIFPTRDGLVQRVSRLERGQNGADPSTIF